jgi:hypothetical protein
MEVLNPSFLKTQVPYVMQIETEVPKNKVFKSQVLKMYLTQKYVMNFLFCFSLVRLLIMYVKSMSIRIIYFMLG